MMKIDLEKYYFLYYTCICYSVQKKNTRFVKYIINILFILLMKYTVLWLILHLTNELDLSQCDFLFKKCLFIIRDIFSH